MPTDVEILAEALKRLEARHGTFKMELALRHPGNRSDSAVQALEMIEAMIATLEASEPEVGRILRMGFDPQHDVGGKPNRYLLPLPGHWFSGFLRGRRHVPEVVKAHP